jgi:hypothetical protein
MAQGAAKVAYLEQRFKYGNPQSRIRWRCPFACRCVEGRRMQETVPRIDLHGSPNHKTAAVWTCHRIVNQGDATSSW